MGILKKESEDLYMWCNQIFSQIKDDTIKNIIVADNYEMANYLAREIYGEGAFAVESTQYPTSIGDKYIGGVFYFKDGETRIPRTNTAEEDVQIALQKAEKLQANLDYIAMESAIEL